MADSFFLLLPARGDRGFPGIVRKVHLLALRRLLTAPTTGLSRELAAVMPRVQALLADCARRSRAQMLQALACPDILVPLLVWEAGLAQPEATLRAAVPPLLIRLARAQVLQESVVWPGPIQRVIDEDGRNVHELTDPAPALMVAPGQVELRLANGRLVHLVGPDAPPIDAESPPFFQIRPGLLLSEVDTNPLSWLEEHPDKQGNAVDLGGRTPSDWVRSLQQALELVEQALPGWAAELPVALHRMIPVGYHSERHLSASYREAPGLCYLTLHPDPVTMAEAIIHETQHGKLNALSHLDPVLHNGRTTWTASPVRPDLRPLMGVLLAVHAFVPVAAFHAALVQADHPLSRTDRFRRRRREVLAGNARGLAVVEDKAQPSPAGRRLLRDLRRLHDDLAAQIPDLDPDRRALPPG